MTWQYWILPDSNTQRTRNSAIADKPRDAFVQMHWRGWPMLQCQIWSFCVIGCRHKHRRTPKIGERWNSAHLGWEVWLTPSYTPFPTCYHVKFRSSATKSVRINRKEPPKLRSAGIPRFPPLLGWGKVDHLNTSPLPTSSNDIKWQFVVKGCMYK